MLHPICKSTALRLHRRNVISACVILPDSDCDVESGVKKASEQEPSQPDDEHLSQAEIASIMYNIMFLDSLGGID